MQRCLAKAAAAPAIELVALSNRNKMRDWGKTGVMELARELR